MTSFREDVKCFPSAWIPIFEQQTGFKWQTDVAIVQDPSTQIQDLVKNYFPHCANYHPLEQGANATFHFKLWTRGEIACQRCGIFLNQQDLIHCYSCRECYVDICKECYKKSLEDAPFLRLSEPKQYEDNKNSVTMDEVTRYLENDVFHIPSGLFSAALFVPVLCNPTVSPLLAHFKLYFVLIQYAALYATLLLQLLCVCLTFRVAPTSTQTFTYSNLICLAIFCFKMVAEYNEIVAGFMWVMLPVQPDSLRAHLSESMRSWQFKLIICPKLFATVLFHYLADCSILTTTTATNSLLVTVMLFAISYFANIVYEFITPMWLKAANSKGLYLISPKTPRNYRMQVYNLFFQQMMEILLSFFSMASFLLNE